MTCPTRSALPVAVVSTAVTPPERVFVRPPSGGISLLWGDALGFVTHRDMLGTMVMRVHVALCNGVVLSCDPTWVHPAPNVYALLNLPPKPAAPC